jgi:uncharacterized membrane protein YdjX (TVP38/TMEM64 family)
MSNAAQNANPSRQRAVLGLAIFVLVLAAAWAGARHFGLLGYAEPANLQRIIRVARAARWAIPIFVLTYAAAATLGLPATPFTLAGGAIFGVGLGTALNWAGATLGATGAYFVARLLGRDAVRTLLGRRAAALDRLASDGAFASLTRLRLLPVVPFNGLNFGAGLAGVPVGAYVLSTAVGIIPGTFVYTYFADALLAGAAGARQGAFVNVLLAGGLLVALSFAPALARRMRWLPPPALLLAAIGVLGPASVVAQGTTNVVDHSSYSAMLAQYVTNGMVDYNAFAKDPRFPAYLRQLDAVDPAKLARDERLAFWINTYNAYTIQLINGRRERRSIRNINKRFGITFKSPWAEPIVHAAGRVLSLDDVEHKIVRPEFKDPRVHVALVCAAMGCPPLRSEAFVGSRINEQLDEQAVRFLSQAHKNRVDVSGRAVHGSPIFTWYRADFGGTLAGVGAFWARYVPAGPERELLRSGNFSWTDTDYDWSLNLRR